MKVVGWERFVRSQGVDDALHSVTVGVFDGVHRGHQHLLSLARGHGRVCVVTFSENPRAILEPSGYAGDITTVRQKLELLESYGAACTVLVDFDAQFRSLPGRVFLDVIRSAIPTAGVVIGSDFRCGVNLDTGAHDIVRQLAAYGVRVDIAQPVQDNGQSVSSTRIRLAIQQGRIDDARRMLGHPFVLDLRDMEAESADGRIPRELVTQVCPEGGSYRVRLAEGRGDVAVDMTVFPDYIEIHRAGRCDLIEFLNRKPTPVA